MKAWSVMVTRPFAQGKILKAELEQHQITVWLDPLLEIHFLAYDSLILAQAEGIIATSRYALEGLEQSLMSENIKNFPLYVVGSKTAFVAYSLGWQDVQEGGGTARDLLMRIKSAATPKAGYIVYARGKDISYDIKGSLEEEGYQVKEVIIYEAQAARGFIRETIRKLQKKAFNQVLFFSRRTAETFKKLCKQQDLEDTLRDLEAVCLSPLIAEALLPLPFKKIKAVQFPTKEAMVKEVLTESGLQVF